MYTEDEARTKWCSEVRYSTFNGEHPNGEASINCHGNSDRHEDFNCIASDCMMWRVKSGMRAEQGRDKSLNKPIRPDEGYCGLAGKP